MSAGFTPGPWEAEPECGRGAWIKGAEGEWSTLACGKNNDIARANARLIAAAPDLYEALTECADDLESEINARYGDTDAHPALKRRYDRDMATITRARAALTKATGK